MAEFKVLICDDHPIFRNGLKTVLADSEQVQIVGEASNGIECIEQVKALSPNIVLLDIRMPEMNGIEALKILTEKHPKVKVIAISQFEESRLIKQMLKHGAAGYVLKHTNHQELIRAFGAVTNGRQYLSDEVYQIQEGLVSDQKKSDKLFPNLTEKEIEVIKLISSELSSRQIAEKLDVSAKTVEAHRSNIFKKIGVNNIAGLVKWAMNNGMV